MDETEKLALAQTLLQLIGHDGLLTLVAGVGGVVVAIVLLSLREVYGLITGKGKGVDYITHKEFTDMVTQNNQEHKDVEDKISKLVDEIHSLGVKVAKLEGKFDSLVDMVKDLRDRKQ